MKFTAIIPTYNEEKNIEACIQSVLFADEILIVDSFSNDKTLIIAQKYPVKIIQREYENSASQKNWAIPQAAHEWILLVDADERVTPELEEEIKEVLTANPDEVGFWIYRKNFFMGRYMKHSGLDTDKVIRLFQRDHCTYMTKNVHSEIVTNGKVGFLKGKLTHNTYTSFDNFIVKKNRYAWWSAGDHFKKNSKIGFNQLFLKPAFRFFKHYVIQLGFLDGVPGVAYAFIESYGVFTRYVKIWLMQKGQYENLDANRPKFLLYLSYPYGITILKPLEKVLLERKYEVAWFLEMPQVKDLMDEKEHILTKPEEVFQYKPSITLAASNEVPHFFPGMKVQVFHGFNASKRKKNVGHFRIRGLFDLYCTHGPSTTKRFKKLEKKMEHFKVIETGWPKMDNLFPLEISRNEIATVLFASTFTKNLSLAHVDEIYDEIQRLISINKYQWIFTLHDKMDPLIVDKYKSLAEKHNFPFIQSPTTLDHLIKADILLTDTSSIINEFIQMEKPVVSYRNARPKKHLINIQEVNELEEALDFGLSYPQKLLKSIKKFNKKEHPYRDGKSGERIIDAVVDFHNEMGVCNLKRKPFNFVRKYMINKKFQTK